MKHPSCRIVAMHVVLHMSVCLSVTLTNDHIHDIDGSPSEGHTILRQLLAKQFAVILGFSVGNLHSFFFSRKIDEPFSSLSSYSTSESLYQDLHFQFCEGTLSQKLAQSQYEFESGYFTSIGNYFCSQCRIDLFRSSQSTTRKPG